MTDNIKVIFNDDDLHNIENLDPNHLKVFFGTDNVIPPCDPKWKTTDGDKIDVDCSCKQIWQPLDGDNVSINVGCIVIPCDPTWKDTTNMSNDFGCDPCVKNWDDVTGSVDFNVTCGEKPENTLGTIRAYSGENATFTIHGLEVFKAYSGESVTFDLDVRQTIMPPITAYSGEDVKIGLTNDVRIVSSVYSGEDVKVDLKTVPVVTFNPTALSGESASTVLRTDVIYDPSISHGETVTFDLNTRPSAKLDPVVLIGEYSSVVLNTNKAFNVNVYSGEDVKVNLEAAPNPNLEINAYDGSEVVNSISTTVSLASNSTSGERVTTDLATTFSFEINAYDGSESNVTFYEAKNQTFDIRVLDGVYTNMVFNTYSGFTINMYSGESVVSNIEFDPYQGYPMNMYSGESVSLSLSKDIELTTKIETGESVNVTLDTRESFKIEPKVYHGETATLKPSYSEQIGIFKFYSGESAAITNLDELPNWKVFSGESVELTLATETNISANANSGETVNVNLKYGEPINLGAIRAYSGEYIETDIKMQISTYFRVRAGDGSKMIVNDHMTKPHYIDLDKRKCCAYIDNDIKHIEMDYAPYNWDTYSPIGVCERMTVDLSARTTFKINAYAGENFKYDNTKNTFEMRFKTGEFAKIPKFSTNTHIDLETGNLIPDSDNVVIEIDRPNIPPEAVRYNMYSGETMVIKNFGVPYGLRYQFPNNGESVSVSLDTYPAWRLNFSVGERCDVILSTNNTYMVRASNGESVISRFYEPPWTVYSGESVSVSLDTKSDYYAEFIDSGCLVNDYHDIDENGQPIITETDGESIEGYKFLKFVQGRCY